MSDAPEARRLHPIVPIVSLVRRLPEMAVPMVGVVAVARDEGFIGTLLAIGVFLAAFLVFQALAWWRFTYTLLANEMYIESGVLSRNRRSIPWDRVQDVEIERGPVARFFGLAKVKLQTGASGSDEGVLDSIALDDALALREEIRARRGIAAVASPHEEAARPPVFKMTLRRILQAGLFNFSLLWLALIAGASQYLDDVFPRAKDAITAWVGAHESELIGMIGPAMIALAVVLFLLLGTVAGVIDMLVRNFGFTLSHEGRTLRRVRGLLTRSEVAIPLHRIQGARTVAHWIMRRMGLCRVEVQSMGAFGGMQDLAPLATASEAEHVLSIAGRFMRIAPERFKPVAALHVWYGALSEALPLALISLAAGYLWPAAWWGIVVAAAWGAVLAIAARQHGWLVEGDMLHVRSGWISQDHWLLPLANVQSVSLTEGPLQRRLGLATVEVDSAGAPMGGLRIRNLTTSDARALAEVLRAWRRPKSGHTAATLEP